MADWRFLVWNIPPRIRRVLIYVAKYGPAWGYHIHKKLAIPSSSAYDSLKKLEKAGWLKGEIDETWGISLNKKNYSLTITGFCQIMSLADADEFYEIISAQQHLIPFVLGKWNLFKDSVVEDLALRKLIESALSHRSQSIYRPDLTEYGVEKNIQNIFTHNFYHPFSKEIRNDKERIEWIQICSQDVQISKFLHKQLEAVKRYLIQDISAIDGMLKIVA